jgi:hypothetical protein
MGTVSSYYLFTCAWLSFQESSFQSLSQFYIQLISPSQRLLEKVACHYRGLPWSTPSWYSRQWAHIALILLYHQQVGFPVLMMPTNQSQQSETAGMPTWIIPLLIASCDPFIAPAFTINPLPWLLSSWPRPVHQYRTCPNSSFCLRPGNGLHVFLSQLNGASCKSFAAPVLSNYHMLLLQL